MAPITGNMRLLILILSLLSFTVSGQQILLQGPPVWIDTSTSNLWFHPNNQNQPATTGSGYAWNAGSWFCQAIRNDSTVGVYIKRFSLLMQCTGGVTTNQMWAFARTTGSLTNGTQIGKCSRTNLIWYGAAPGHTGLFREEFVWDGSGIYIPPLTDFWIGAQYTGTANVGAITEWTAEGNHYEIGYGAWLDNVLHDGDVRETCGFDIYILPQAPMADYTNGLVAYWPCDITNYGGINCTPDMSGNGNHLYITNTGNVYLYPYISNCIQLYDTKATALDSPTLGFASNTTMTMTMWIIQFPPSDTTYHVCLSKNNGAGQYNYELSLNNNTGNKQLLFYNGLAADISTNTIQMDRFTHAAMVVNGPSVTFYSQGRVIGVGTNRLGNINNSDLHWGWQTAAGTYYSRAIFDEIRLYTNALTQDQIRTVMNWWR